MDTYITKENLIKEIRINHPDFSESDLSILHDIHNIPKPEIVALDGNTENMAEMYQPAMVGVIDFIMALKNHSGECVKPPCAYADSEILEALERFLEEKKQPKGIAILSKRTSKKVFPNLLVFHTECELIHFCKMWGDARKIFEIQKLVSECIYQKPEYFDWLVETGRSHKIRRYKLP